MRWLSVILPVSALALSLFPASRPATAQIKPARAPAAASAEPEELKRFEAALPKLELWPEQKPRLQKLVQDLKGSIKKIQEGPGTQEQKQELLKGLKAKAKDRLDHVLTVAQAEKLKTLMAPPSTKHGGPARR